VINELAKALESNHARIGSNLRTVNSNNIETNIYKKTFLIEAIKFV
jgi:hypothetical protein